MTVNLDVLNRERTVAPAGFSRWLIPPAALAVHLSIGQVYAFSVFKTPLTGHFHTALTPIAIIFSIAIVMLGLSAAFGGAWVERNGPRKAMALSAICWSGGFLVSALGIQLGWLWLVYLGYGVLGGIGLGIGYISPVSTLIRWFPDRPGMATGLAIMGFGGGALIAAPLSTSLMGGLSLSQTFVALGLIYLVAMLLGAATVRVPPVGWSPNGGEVAPVTGMPVNEAFRTRTFWLLWIVLFCNVTAGIGILEQASPMIHDFFPEVNAAQAAGYVGLLSLCNMAGRFVWSATSDLIGRTAVYTLYLGLGAILYLLLATTGQGTVSLFVLVTGLILSFYGGGFATVPAYLKDQFGGFNVGAIHGRLLTAWSAAGVVGPLVVNAIADHQIALNKSGADRYVLALYIMVGVLAVGLLANLLVRRPT
ncbi:MFS transporter [Pseudonocardiaceae bacterium YIM PH 21723]|nr:MFS transporter [Pseudonocardiaceae bacterium YIM PH 21723]